MLPKIIEDRGIDAATWETLKNSIFPGAAEASIVMALDYCRARKLDILKKPCHIVPMLVRDAKTDRYEYRDVIMPGIAEYRTTAFRTGEYAGQDEPSFGPEITYLGVRAPQYCKVTVYRLIRGRRCAFSHVSYFVEECATKGGKNGPLSLNAMWTKRPYGQSAKCAEAGALRKGFPEELGGETTAEEMDGKEIDMGIVARESETEIKQPKEKVVEVDPEVEKQKEFLREFAKDFDVPCETPQNKPENKAENAKTISDGQKKILAKQIELNHCDMTEFCLAFQIAELSLLPAANINEAIKWCKENNPGV